MSDIVKKATAKKKYSNKYLKIFLCGLLGSGIFFLLLAAVSFLSVKSGISDSLFVPICLFISLISGFVSGYFAVKPIMHNGIGIGSVSGLFCLFVVSLLLFFINGAKAGVGLIIISAVILCSAAAGGIVCVGTKAKRKH